MIYLAGADLGGSAVKVRPDWNTSARQTPEETRSQVWQDLTASEKVSFKFLC